MEVIRFDHRALLLPPAPQKGRRRRGSVDDDGDIYICCGIYLSFLLVCMVCVLLLFLLSHNNTSIKKLMMITTSIQPLSVSKHPSSIPQSPTVYNPKRIFPFFGVKKWNFPNLSLRDRSQPCRPEYIPYRSSGEDRVHLHWRIEPWIHTERGGVPETIFTSFSTRKQCGFSRWEPCFAYTPRRHVRRLMIMNG